jgi:hypothetical protein
MGTSRQGAKGPARTRRDWPPVGGFRARLMSIVHIEGLTEGAVRRQPHRGLRGRRPCGSCPLHLQNPTGSNRLSTKAGHSPLVARVRHLNDRRSRTVGGRLEVMPGKRVQFDLTCSPGIGCRISSRDERATCSALSAADATDNPITRVMAHEWAQLRSAPICAGGDGS